jgi:Tfp pilus assembly protein PilF
MKQKILWISLITIVLVIGVLYISKKPTPPASTVPKEQALESIKETITKTADCPLALTQLADLIKDNPSYAEAWQWQGVCQFQGKDFVAAKVSFEKALALDPEIVASKNYLKLINSGAQASVPNLEFQADFENKLGFTPNSQILTFQRIPVRQITPGATGSTEFIIGLYTSQKSGSEIQTYLTNTLKKLTSASFTVTKGTTNTTFNVILVPGKKSYTISVDKSSPIQVLISYSSKE